MKIKIKSNGREMEATRKDMDRLRENKIQFEVVKAAKKK